MLLFLLFKGLLNIFWMCWMMWVCFARPKPIQVPLKVNIYQYKIKAAFWSSSDLLQPKCPSSAISLCLLELRGRPGFPGEIKHPLVGIAGVWHL